MSRYYKILVGPETTSPTGFTPASNNAGAMWTNFLEPKNGQPGRADLGAQTVEFDIWNYSFDEAVSLGSVKIWGPSKAQIAQAFDFNGADIQVFAGMQPGLPLATADYNAKQQGLILSGQIFQSFGNWQGVNQTLDFVVIPNPGGTQSQPANLAFNWQQGQPLSEAINSVLSAAFPNFKSPKININSALVLPNDEPFTYTTFEQFCKYVRNLSQNILGANQQNYQGVLIAQQGNQFLVFDGTKVDDGTTSNQIATKDLIGQVTWLGPYQIQFNTVLRADLRIGDTVQFEPIAGLQAITSVQSASNVRQQNTFAGNWQITKVRHVGNSRAPDAQSWITTFQAISQEANPEVVTPENTSA